MAVNVLLQMISLLVYAKLLTCQHNHMKNSYLDLLHMFVNLVDLGCNCRNLLEKLASLKNDLILSGVAWFAACPSNFEYLNYTIITSQCKGPLYPANVCCAAFLELACPYAAEINDLTNNCATILFSYININGNYPPGLFASECQDTNSKVGVMCPATAPTQTANDSGTKIVYTPSPLVALTTGFLLLLLRFFWRLIMLFSPYIVLSRYPCRNHCFQMNV